MTQRLAIRSMRSEGCDVHEFDLRMLCADGAFCALESQACMMHVLGIAKGNHAMARFRDWQLRDLYLPRPVNPCRERGVS